MCIISSGRPTEITHAYCKIVWIVGLPCDQVNTAIVTQIKTMGSYRLGPVTPSLVQSKHTSAPGQMESVNFTMSPTFRNLGCHLEGSSASAFWYSLMDNGTNYCNLYTVIQGSGLTRAPGFVEFSNEWLCLGYRRSTCQ
ncbi:hypothetical protein Q5P01_022621 [Channa striata]|uniref:Uncharacterized protein n=1 Tax=Channa striata TaxID=64152 RepID=A0AA88J5H0_CHASR|nr:hypothetical protein Q5P01_022621 [Channa striata]